MLVMSARINGSYCLTRWLPYAVWCHNWNKTYTTQLL